MRKNGVLNCAVLTLAHEAVMRLLTLSGEHRILKTERAFAGRVPRAT